MTLPRNKISFELQINAKNYFDYYFYDADKPIVVPDDIKELDKLIEKKTATLEFINEIYHECFDAKAHLSYDEHIHKSMLEYKKNHEEQVIYEKSLFFVYDMGDHFVETSQKNIRNWIYAKEVKKAYKILNKKIENLEIILQERKLT
jgi:hypothetical protein